MEVIRREEVRTLLDQNPEAKVVEVLDKPQYDTFHLPGAINVPLSSDFDDEIEEAVPDKSRPVIVYCMDEDCDASPKAAKRMDQLGYDRVYDYAAGKKDWKNSGLPTES